MYKNYIKRILDVVISLICIVVLIPFYILISLVVLLKMGRPVLFSQERIGKGEKTFRLYKFRSMTNAKDRNGNLLEEEKRLTKTGIFLRSSSLDELPEFFFNSERRYVSCRTQTTPYILWAVFPQ